MMVVDPVEPNVMDDSLVLGPVVGALAGPRQIVPLNKYQRKELMVRFNAEGRYQRRLFRKQTK
jgi:hypothetical protein